MRDHTEREREARDSLASLLCESLYLAFPASESANVEASQHSDVEPCAFCTKRVSNAFSAVRAAVLAEVRAKVEGMATRHEKQDCTLCTLDLVCHSAWLAASHNAALHAILTALEATDGN